ncbi:hypothetical protein [Rickettsia asembonensis]|uniref:hypothetical protein n=1 Tax=Rickettsia asembonensis TaxID=1068590 RepID=UPI00130DB362|nr:hypothetical protein [Rickettsia asembonensis]
MDRKTHSVSYRGQASFVAWLEKPTRCHSREGGNPEKSEINRAFNFKNLLYLHLLINGFPRKRE